MTRNTAFRVSRVIAAALLFILCQAAVPRGATAQDAASFIQNLGEALSRFVENIVNESFALRFGHGVPIQTAGGCELAHVILALAGGRLPPLWATPTRTSRWRPFAGCSSTPSSGPPTWRSRRTARR